jgi:hypothetical protein
MLQIPGRFLKKEREAILSYQVIPLAPDLSKWDEA